MISVTCGLNCSYNSNMEEKTPLELEQELSKVNTKIERLNNIINELENKIWYLYNYTSLDTSNLKKELQELKERNK